jgi:biopolymer transport protein ExbD
MAEISTSDKGGSRRSRQSTRVDMTPMVDLGFLLITFFMLTTTLLKPVTMQLSMPDKTTDNASDIRESETLTVILDKENKVYYYQGIPTDPNVILKTTNFSDKGIRQILFNYKTKIGKNFTVVIKATDQAHYRNMVDLLDELAITNNKQYAIVNTLTTNEQNLLSLQSRPSI